MNTKLNRQQLYFLIAMVLLVSTCSPSGVGGPESGARTAFEEWARQVSVPYKDVSYQVLESDDAFASVRVVATLRETATQDWLEKQADIECRQVGGQWQCNLAFAFSLTEAEDARQRQIAAGTATAATIKLHATATELSRQAQVTQEALLATKAVAKQAANATATADALAITATALVSPKMREIAADKPTTASDFYRYSPSRGFRPYSVVDRQTEELHCDASTEEGNTYWLLPDHQTGWIQINLQQTYEIVKLRWLNTHNGSCNDRATTRYHIALSQTGAFTGEERIVREGTMSFSASPQFNEFTLPEPIQAQYVRFYVDGYYNWGGGLNELEVYVKDAAP